MKVAVIGSGYVGLVAGACFADTGNAVWCVDQDARKIDALRAGRIPIYEPGLEEMVRRGTAEGRLRFTVSTAEAVREAEVVFLAVGTPTRADGQTDLSALKAAAEQVAKAMTGYCLIVNKSTVPIGMHKAVAEWMRPHTSHDFDVASNPEFLKEGSAVQDFLKPDRVIVGTDKEAVFRRMEELYAPFVRQGNPVMWMDPVSAEVTKYACNAFLATRISFMNEMALLCEKAGGDVEAVRKGMASDVRIGKHFLYAGVGYGGSCFPKDVKALVHTAKGMDVNLGVVRATEEANERQKRHLAWRVKERFGTDLNGRTFAVWGLAFKPNTDDMREAPSLTIIGELRAAGARIQAFDPISMENARRLLGDQVAQYGPKRDDVLKGADALLVLTEWNEFRQPDWDAVKAKLKNPVVFDGRNLYTPTEMAARGFTHVPIGRPVTQA